MSNIKNVKWVDIKSVKPWKDNPRKNDEAVEKLADLLAIHGIKSPLVAWEKNRVVYKGNTTLKAAKLLGLKKVPVAFVPFPSLSAAKAYGIADNKSSEFSEWDNEVLYGIMSAKGMKDKKVTGFDTKEIDSLFGTCSHNNEGPSSNDVVLGSIKLVFRPEDHKKIALYLKKTLLKKYGQIVVMS